MFLRQMGRRILILHSYRDGLGKVCQRRLGHFLDSTSLEKQLDELPGRCPEFAGEWVRLRQRAQALLDSTRPLQPRERQARKAIQTLLNWLAEGGDPELVKPLQSPPTSPVAEGGEEHKLRAHVQATRDALPSQRGVFGHSDQGDYWQGFGDLWNVCCRRFIMAICAQHLVRRRLRQALEAGVVVRNLVPPSSQGWLVQRGIEAALA